MKQINFNEFIPQLEWGSMLIVIAAQLNIRGAQTQVWSPPTTSGLEMERVQYSGRQEIEEKVRCIKKEEGKIQIGKVSKNKNTNKPHSHSAEINKWIAGTNYLRTYGPGSPHGAHSGQNDVNDAVSAFPSEGQITTGTPFLLKSIQERRSCVFLPDYTPLYWLN